MKLLFCCRMDFQRAKMNRSRANAVVGWRALLLATPLHSLLLPSSGSAMLRFGARRAHMEPGPT